MTVIASVNVRTYLWSMKDAELNQLAMDLLEYRFVGTALRCEPGARPIAFDLVGECEETWLCNPRSTGRVFEKCAASDVDLRVRCRPQMLVRLVQDPSFEVEAEDEFSVRGDLDALAMA